MTTVEVMALIAQDLQRVEEAIGTDTICSVDAVTAISNYLQRSGGKRLRPSLVLLSAGLLGYRGESAIRLGAVVEIVHTATLVHDDVIDKADVRRGRPSINSRWDNHVSVLSGDWLYMQGLSLAIRERSLKVLDILIDLTQQMVEAELMQKEWLGRVDITEAEHLDLITRKTACLFSVCARLGALSASADEETEQRLGDFGWNLGVAFQMVDDLLDFTSTEEELGKPVGSDLRDGKVTWPVISALARSDEAARERVATVIREKGYDSVKLADIQTWLQDSGALNVAREKAAEYTAAALAKITPFPDTPHKRALVSITDKLVDRTY